MAKHIKKKESKKTIGLIILGVLLVIAVGIIAYQIFYPQNVGPKKEASFAQSSKSTNKSEKKSSTKQTSESTSSQTTNSSSEGTTSSSSSQATTPASWNALSDTQHDAVYAQWVNNAQGKYDIFTGEAYRIYIVNVGSNGVSGYSDPVNVIQNTARVQVNADGTYYLQVADPTQTGLRMMQNPWPVVNWKTKETLTGAQLFAKYGAKASLATGAAQIQSVKNTTVPTGQ